MMSSAPSLRHAAVSRRVQPALLPQITSKSPRAIEPSRSFTRTTKKPAAIHLPRVRHFSTSSSKSDAVAQKSTAQKATDPESPPLDWNSFFKLRKVRRRWQLGASIGTGLFGSAAGAQVIMTAELERFVTQIPLDPFITMGFMTMGCGGLGWLMGPIVGTSIFNMFNGRHKQDIMNKEKEFYARIKKHRVDPSASSMANPVPDYYGEKIGSVAGYRQWLKDQRAFNKKRQTFV